MADNMSTEQLEFNLGEDEEPATVSFGKDANGNQAQKTLTPTVDPYQQQTNVLALRQPYRMDGFTKLTIPIIYAQTTITLRIYPSDTINLARGLAGRSVSQEYGNPGIVKAQPLKLV